jgi:TonB family protein
MRALVVAAIVGSFLCLTDRRSADAQTLFTPVLREVPPEFLQDARVFGSPGLEAPVPASTVEPKYAAAAMLQKLQGTVQIDVVIGANGRVLRTRIARSLDSVYGLDDSALDAVKRWTFAPGVLGGQAVPVLARISLTFALQEPFRLSVATDVPADFVQNAVAIDVVGLEAPLVRERVEAKYTSTAMIERIQGTVEVDVVIGLDGSVLRARVAKSLDPRWGLDENAIFAARQWKFTPGTLNGRPVTVLARVPVDFRFRTAR